MIDRYNLVERHNPVLKKIEKSSPLSVGNGNFAFTADITGLQSFPEIYEDEIPLCTMAQWGWHSFPAKNRDYQRDKLKLKFYQGKEREIPYASEEKGQEGLFNFLRENPHKFNLGQIGFDIRLANGNKMEVADTEDIEQRLDMWQGVLYSHFSVEGIPVTVKTICHPYRDILALSINSELIKEGRMALDIRFPYAAIDKSASDWDKKDSHETRLIKRDSNKYEFMRIMDNTNYFLSFNSSASGEMVKLSKHRYQYRPGQDNNEIKLILEFTDKPGYNENLEFTDIEKSSKDYWYNYWNNGGVVDLSASTDPRAGELERRIILSQYLTAIQCSGIYPPQETGLTCNSWYGKFHLEMHFWHAAHFPLWGRPELLERSLWWYQSTLERGRELASSQGYRGARWPKMVGPVGYDSPSSIGPFLIWQQPHPIFYAELLYKINPMVEILNYYKEIVYNTAEFMVSFVEYDQENDRFILGSPLIPAQECHQPEETLNPTFELEYWYFALNIAQRWRERFGLKRDKKWQKVIDKLSALPVKDNLYLAHENCPDTFVNKNYDHPSMLGAYGVLPGNKVDPGIMLNTLQQSLESWQFEEVWGWDFPLMAMTAARLGERELAVDLLLTDSPKNTYLINGHNRQGEKKELPLYLPGNGGLLLAVGMMAGGWEGAPAVTTPGFPHSWTVRTEGIKEYF